jgi:hypothetical protein
MSDEIQITIHNGPCLKKERKNAIKAKPCAHCGTIFKRTQGLFCSRECGYSAIRKLPVSVDCEVCGSGFKPTGRSANRACSRKCGFDLIRMDALRKRDAKVVACDHPPMPKTCAECARMFISSFPNALYCSNDCSLFACAKRSHPDRYSPRQCCVCSNTFTPKYRDWGRTTCGNKCRAMEQKHGKAAAKHIRRARLSNAPSERFRAEEIFIRDGYRCGICGKLTNAGAKVPHPRAPTLDHIWPIAKGGGHTRVNTQCAHFICNSLKSDAAGGQTRLAI